MTIRSSAPAMPGESEQDASVAEAAIAALAKIMWFESRTI